MERWNPDNMMYKKADEFKYLEEIKNLISLSKDVTKGLNEIYDSQRYIIQLGKEKYIHNFSEIKEKLDELKELLNE